MDKTKDAVACFKEGFSCSQAILSTYGPSLGIDKATALKISTPFGGGMARMGKVCGAVTGAFMVIGLAAAKDKAAKERVYSLVNEFTARFTACNGSISCRELLDCDLSTDEGQKKFKENNMLSKQCTNYVQKAAEIIESLLPELGK